MTHAERLAQARAAYEQLAAQLPEMDRAHERLKRHHAGRDAVHHHGRRESAWELCGQLETRLACLDPASPDHARFSDALATQRAVLQEEEAALARSLEAGGFTDIAQARSARMHFDEVETLTLRVELFAERYDAAVARLEELEEQG